MSVEKTAVLPPKEQHRIASNLNTVGKKSAQGLSEEERKSLLTPQRV